MVSGAHAQGLELLLALPTHRIASPDLYVNPISEMMLLSRFNKSRLLIMIVDQIPPNSLQTLRPRPMNIVVSSRQEILDAPTYDQ